MTTAALSNSATAGEVATALDAALSAAGITVDVASSNASGLTFTLLVMKWINITHSTSRLRIQLALLQALQQSQQGVTSANTVVFTENLGIDSKPYLQHTFTVNMTVNEGEGQGVSDAGFRNRKTTNDNALPVNVIEGGAAVTTVSAVSEVITIADFTAASSAAAYTVTIGGANYTTSSVAANASAGAIASALDTALSAAGITVASTASGDLTLTFDTGGDRTDEASTINFTTNPSTGFDAGTATVATQGVDSYESGTSSVDIQTNTPAGTQPFTFGITDLTSPLGLASQ